jgi:hypothetical protein
MAFVPPVILPALSLCLVLNCDWISGAREHGWVAAGAVREARLPHAHLRHGSSRRPATSEELRHG